MEDTDFRELGRQLLTEFGSMHQRISRFADKALGGEMAVMRALMRAGGSLTPSELADRAWVSSARIANILRALEANALSAARDNRGLAREVKCHDSIPL